MEIEEAKKRGIDLESLKKEQLKLAKTLSIKDDRDFGSVEKVAGISNVFDKNIIFSGIVLLDSSMEILAQEYYTERTSFPYIPGFRAYRELPAMAKAIEKLEEKPEVIFVSGHGIAHPSLGLASHLSLVTGIPTVGVAKELIHGELDGDDILLGGKKVGRVLKLKEFAAPLYVSPGNLISVKSAAELVKKFSKNHKLPEPLHIAHKYADRCLKEFSSNGN